MESTRTSHLPVSTMRVREGRLEQKYHTYVHEVQIPDTTPIARLPYQLALSRATRERRESDERATRERRESDERATATVAVCVWRFQYQG